MPIFVVMLVQLKWQTEEGKGGGDKQEKVEQELQELNQTMEE